MNRTRIITTMTAVLISAVTAFSQVTFVGLAGDYGTKIREPGFSAIGFYTVNQQIDITPNFTYYLTHTEDIPDGEKKSTWWSVNLDGHYNIFQFGVFEGYGLMGLNFTNITTQTNEVIQGEEFDDKKNETKAGMNIGFGGTIHFSRWFTPFTEFKYSLVEGAAQAGIRAGILVRINDDKEREPEDF